MSVIIYVSNWTQSQSLNIVKINKLSHIIEHFKKYTNSITEHCRNKINQSKSLNIVK